MTQPFMMLEPDGVAGGIAGESLDIEAHFDSRNGGTIQIQTTGTLITGEPVVAPSITLLDESQAPLPNFSGLPLTHYPIEADEELDLLFVWDTSAETGDPNFPAPVAGNRFRAYITCDLLDSVDNFIRRHKFLVEVFIH